mgnify:CR=1 FL=1
MGLYAVIRLRSGIKAPKEIKDTLMLLNLRYINNCVILPINDSIKGMLEKVKDYVTYGEIDEDTLTLLLEKKLRKIGDKKVTEEDLKKYNISSFRELAKKLLNGEVKLKDFKEFKRVFRLRPTKLKSKKLHFPKGDLGYRGEKINELIKRMI